MVFDGDCHFCRRWIERWRELTAGAVDYEPFQEIADRFPEISRADFERAVQFIETDGTIFRAAEAVFRSLGHKRSRRWTIWCYEHLSAFAGVTEAAYRFIARHRQFASFFTRLLWGEDVRRPTYFTSRRWFLRALGAVYFIAFVSLWAQVDGLIGANGILPVAQFLPAAHDQVGANTPFVLPTLCWFNSSNAFLHFLCGGGAIVSLLLVAGFVPVLALTVAFVFYLSLTVAGQTFLSFQWDILLLETGFLAIFFAPWQWRVTATSEVPISRVAHFLLKLLLFKFLLMSGVVKLTSGDDSWWNLSALNYHYWTQPLPTVIGWWSDQHADWFKKVSVAFCLVVEIIVPFFIWAPRRLRLIAAALLIFLQIAIAATGNYCFFNLLTVALCLLLLDDSVLGRRSQIPIEQAFRLPGSYPAMAVLLVTLPLNAMLVLSAFKPEVTWPRPIAALYGYIEPFRIANGYGLFRVLTKSRPEIILEGSADGVNWLPYQFKWKPGDVMQPPQWVAPHQPRLDWQMWFAAFSTYQQNLWFVRLVDCLLEDKAEVIGLLARNPFPNDPPRYIRAMLYDYHFASLAEHKATGIWWKRHERGAYLPSVSLQRR